MEPPRNQSKAVELFRQGPDLLENTLDALSEQDLDYAPSNGGWTIRQIVHHLVDGDDIWKNAVKMALGNEGAEFSLAWYQVIPQTDWAKQWSYEKRPIDISLELFKANRNHILQLLEYVPEGWSRSVQYLNHTGEIETVPVGFIIQMQADHLVHHVKRIEEIRKEITRK